jgi:ribonuclease P protein component
MVVPKRHARRSVTRNLIKRQMRQVMDVMVQRARGNPAEGLPRGLWVLRLKSPFDPRQFHSPASDPLRQAAHDEIESLLARAVVGAPSPGRGSSRGPRDRSGPAALQTAPAA